MRQSAVRQFAADIGLVPLVTTTKQYRNTDVNSVDIIVVSRYCQLTIKDFNDETRVQLPAADVLFTGGPVFTGFGEPLPGHAVAVIDGRVAAIVPEAEASAHIGEETTVIQLGGALLSPGFQDAHIHPVSGGVELLQCDLTGTENAEEAVAASPSMPQRTPTSSGSWAAAGRWTTSRAAPPPASLIDAVVSDRPVLLSSRDHHSSWANTKAFEIAGITAATPDPADGRIERESDGTPAGALQEGASELFNHVRPETTDDLAYQGLLRAQEELFALGITGWQDALVGTGLGMADSLAIYERAARRGNAAGSRRRRPVVGAQHRPRAASADDRASRCDRRPLPRQESSTSARSRSWSTASPRTRPPP